MIFNDIFVGWHTVKGRMCCCSCTSFTWKYVHKYFRHFFLSLLLSLRAFISIFYTAKFIFLTPFWSRFKFPWIHDDFFRGRSKYNKAEKRTLKLLLPLPKIFCSTMIPTRERESLDKPKNEEFLLAKYEFWDDNKSWLIQAIWNSSLNTYEWRKVIWALMFLFLLLLSLICNQTTE